ncbi:MAG: radical SAM protein, partial [Acidobacteria bacterium]|nr:radical SAM protein [Acidobacteriota bacterium]
MVVLLSTYELGRPAFGVASAAAWLRTAGHVVHTVDLSRGPLPELWRDAATLFAVHVPMHTATRLAGPLLARLRDARPDATRVVFGLYAPLNERWLRDHGATHVLGVEAEADLVAVAAGRAPLPIRTGIDLP